MSYYSSLLFCCHHGDCILVVDVVLVSLCSDKFMSVTCCCYHMSYYSSLLFCCHHGDCILVVDVVLVSLCSDKFMSVTFVLLLQEIRNNIFGFIYSGITL